MALGLGLLVGPARAAATNPGWFAGWTVSDEGQATNPRDNVVLRGTNLWTAALNGPINGELEVQLLRSGLAGLDKWRLYSTHTPTPGKIAAYPRLAFVRGAIVVIYEEFGGGTHTLVELRFTSANNVTRQDLVTSNTRFADLSLHSIGDDGLIVMWRDQTDESIRVRHWNDADGWSITNTLSERVVGSTVGPPVGVVDAEGNFFAVWQQTIAGVANLDSAWRNSATDAWRRAGRATEIAPRVWGVGANLGAAGASIIEQAAGANPDGTYTVTHWSFDFAAGAFQAVLTTRKPPLGHAAVSSSAGQLILAWSYAVADGGTEVQTMRRNDPNIPILIIDTPLAFAEADPAQIRPLAGFTNSGEAYVAAVGSTGAVATPKLWANVQTSSGTWGGQQVAGVRGQAAATSAVVIPTSAGRLASIWTERLDPNDPSIQKTRSSVFAVPNEPLKAVNVTAAFVAPGTVDVSWQQKSQLTHKGLPLASFTATTTPGGGSCTAVAPQSTCRIDTLDPNVTYTVQVTQTDTAGNVGAPSDPSAPFQADFPEPTPPQASTITVVADGVVSAEWPAVTPVGDQQPIASYTVTTTPASAGCTSVAPTTTCTIAGLDPGTSYTATVTATDTGGRSSAPGAPSAPFTPSTEPPPPPPPPPGGEPPEAPESLKVKAKKKGKIVLKWSASPSDGVTGYLVDIQKNGGAWKTKDVGDKLRKVYKKVKAGKVACYRVAAVDDTGAQSDWTAEKCVTARR